MREIKFRFWDKESKLMLHAFEISSLTGTVAQVIQLESPDGGWFKCRDVDINNIDLCNMLV